tara:strand:- start:422 stop:580 length:159 start_codon:yes stop_codon:yes gene_type:complete
MALDIMFIGAADAIRETFRQKLAEPYVSLSYRSVAVLILMITLVPLFLVVGL